MENERASLDQKIDRLPALPGVYLFKDKKGTILYIGKAGNIKHRVSSYFRKPADKDLKTCRMVEKVSEIDTLVTDTEKEAFILENNLIKTHHPRYNIKLRDDKNYPCLKLSSGEDFPTVTIVRQIKKDGSLYFGPYPSATSLREALRWIRRLFPIRTCHDTKFSGRLRPCIQYEMDHCTGPCCGKIDREKYQEVVHQVKMFLEGKNKDLIQSLKKKMQEESDQLHFEKAAKIRDQINNIEHVIEKQKIISSDIVDQDVIGFHRRNHTSAIYPLFIRGGKLLGGRGVTISSRGLPDEEVLSSFLHQYYREGRFIPERILIPEPLPEQNLIERWLTERKGKRVRISVPFKGDKKDLLKMACENAQQFRSKKDSLEKDEKKILELLKEKLHLKKVPLRIEAFDISNLQGENAVGSMVFFENGKPDRERYRHFKIKAVVGAGDTGMMYEVLLRHYRKALEKNDLPDLILLDGGRGQLNVALEGLKELRIKEVDLISLAKERTTGNFPLSEKRKTEEKVFHPQHQEPILLGKHSALLHLLDRIRDEAHRFAITYHKKLRTKQTVKSILGEIPEIGKKRQKELLKVFGSVEKIKEATVETLAKTPKMNRRVAQTVYRFFRKGDETGFTNS